MKPNTLLSRAKALAQSSAGTAALTILPISAIVLAAAPAQGQVTFDPAAPTFGSGNFTTLDEGSTAGAAALPSFQGNVGEQSFGSASFTVFPFFEEDARGFSPATIVDSDTFDAVVVSENDDGLSHGSFTLNETIPVSYDFTLASDDVTFGAWQLTLDIRVGVSGGSDNMIVFSGTGAGEFNGRGDITIANEFGTLALAGYSAVLELTVTPNNPFTGGNFSVDVPQHSIDFNAVPEPTTWSFLAGGLLCTASLSWRRKNQSAA